MSRIMRAFLAQEASQPGKIALRCGDDALSYADLAGRVRFLAASLHRRGVRPGEHVGVVLPNGFAFVTLMLAAAKLRLVLVPMAVSLPMAAILKGCAAADVTHLVASEAVLCEFGAYLAGRTDGPGGIRMALSEDDDATAAEFPSCAEAGDSAYILTMTSGSTGDPKPIILTQCCKYARARAAAALYGVTADDIVLTSTPLYHSLAQRLVLMPLIIGGTAVILPGFSAAAWFDAVECRRVSFTIGVAAQLRRVAEQLDDSEQVSSLRCIVSSSALLDVGTKRRLIERLGCDFHECYGASEIAIATNLAPGHAPEKLGSVGRAAPGVDIRILDGDETAAGADTIGEIVCRTPLRFAGYYRRPEQTRAVMWGEYFRTGDLGRLDADGFLHFHGRKNDIISSGGINVFPEDIDSVLAGCDGVAEHAAFAIPHADLGEVVGLAVVFRAGFDQRALRRFCAGNLADFQQPRCIFPMASLPRTPLGKLARHRLLALYQSAMRETQDG